MSHPATGTQKPFGLLNPFNVFKRQALNLADGGATGRAKQEMPLSVSATTGPYVQISHQEPQGSRSLNR